MNFEMFFKQNAAEKENKKIIISERFRDEEGILQNLKLEQ